MTRITNAVLVLLTACGPRLVASDGDVGTTTSADDDDGVTLSGPGTSATTVATTTTTTTVGTSASTDATGGGDDITTSSTDGADGVTVSFVDSADDFGPVTFECDVFAQDCPRGEKCMPWANDGGGVWNATRCAPLVDMPGAPGDACTVEGSPVSGIDDCAAASICWGADPMTLGGACYAQCSGSEANPECADDHTCWIGYDGAVAVCVSPCDPLAPICTALESCVFDDLDGVGRCIPTTLVSGLGYADACDNAIFECGTGLLCTDASDVPTCGATRCCTITGDVNAPPACPEPSQQCLPVYGPGEAPMGLENLCYCGVPA